MQEARLDATLESANFGNILQMAIDVSGLQEQPAPPDESVRPLDYIIQGFHPPPLDSGTTAQIEKDASIQAQLEVLAGRDTVEAPAVQPPVVSTKERKMLR